MKYKTYKVQDVSINDDELVDIWKLIFAPEALIF